MSTSKARKSSLIGSTGIVAGATAFSRILGLIRETVMAYLFGASMVTDAFVTAFRIPNLLRDMFAEGALSSAFVPVFKEKMVKESDHEAFELASTVATAVLVFVGAIVLLGIIAAPALIYISANGFTADLAKWNLTISLTRIMFVYLLLVSLSALVMGILNSFGRFGIPALSPAMFNLGMIGSAFAFYDFFEMPIYALAIGVLIGGTGQLLVQLPPLFKLGFRFRFSADFLSPGFKRVVALFTPMVIGMSAGRINIIVSTLIASFMIDGAMTYLSYAYRLMHFPLGVFAVALGTVSLPKMSEEAALGNKHAMAGTYERSILLNLFVILPSAVFMFWFGQDIVRIVFERGAFNPEDTKLAGSALQHYAYGLVGFAAVRVTVPVFYAMGDSKSPMRISIATVVLNLFLYYPCVLLFDFAGLASATSLAALFNFGFLLYRIPGKGLPLSLPRLGLSIVRLALSAILAVGATTFLPLPAFDSVSPLIGEIISLLISLVTAGLLYVVLCFAMGMNPLKLLRTRSNESNRTA